MASGRCGAAWNGEKRIKGLSVTERCGPTLVGIMKEGHLKMEETVDKKKA